MRRSLASVFLFLILASVALACEAVSHANDFGTSSAVQSCGTGTLFCNGACIAEDAKNCGACNAACEATQVCSGGQCGSQCTGGTTQCNSLCVNLKTDPKNCGRCGGPADAGSCPFCSAGKCVDRCDAPAKICAGSCIDVNSDAQNCGDCGKVCGAGAPICNNGKCDITCGVEAVCSGGCADLDRDPNNCGQCDNQCPSPPENANGPTGEAVCVDRVCKVACNVNLTFCVTSSGGGGNPPECADLQSDPENCGMCGRKCTGGTLVCHQGACISSG